MAGKNVSEMTFCVEWDIKPYLSTQLFSLLAVAVCWWIVGHRTVVGV